MLGTNGRGALFQVVEHDAGAEDVVVDADEVRQLRVEHDAQTLLPQRQRLLLLKTQQSRHGTWVHDRAAASDPGQFVNCSCCSVCSITDSC